MTEEVKYSNYRWVILCIGWFEFAFVFMSWYAVVPRAHDLIPGLGLTLTQFSLIITAQTLMGIFLSIPGGMLGDRFGARMIIGMGGAICAVAGVLRMNVYSFWAMFGCQLFIGLGVSLALPNIPKIVAMWFPPREVGRATGLWITGNVVGSAVILAIGAAFSTWQQTMLIVGVMMAVGTAFWFLLVRDAPALSTTGGVHAVERVRIMESLFYNVKQRNTWLISLVQFLTWGPHIAISGSFPHMLQYVHGISPRMAGAVSSSLIFSMVGGMIIGATVSDRIGLRKPIFYTTIVISGISVFFAWVTAVSIATWILLIISGCFFGAAIPMIFSFPVELPEIGHKWAGGCTGIIVAVGNIGGFLTMPYIFTPVAKINPTFGYGLMALFLVASILPMWFVPEVGMASPRQSRKSLTTSSS